MKLVLEIITLYIDDD